MFSVLPHKTFTVQILYKQYRLQLNCTYSNYTDDATTSSAAQQHSTFTVQMLYKLYSVQLNCTYSNYTEVAPTSSAAQQHSKFTVQMLYKLYSLQLNCTYSNYTQAAATCSAAQQNKLYSWCLLQCSAAGCLKLYSDTHLEIRSCRLTLLAASTVSQFDSDKEQVDVTKVTVTLCKLKANANNFFLNCRFV